MSRASFRDWIEQLLEPGESPGRREALVALSGIKMPLVAEALALARELEGPGALAPAITQASAALRAELGAKADALAADPAVAAFRAPGSPFRPLSIMAMAADTRTYLSIQVGLRRVVALKVLVPKLAGDAGARARMVSDARRLGRVLHPHVAAVLESGEYAGQAFVATELVDGQSLKQSIESQGAVEWPEAVRLAREAASGLAAAHRAGLTHGRVLPATLFVDREERAKLTDFAPSSGQPDPGAEARDLADLGLVLHEMLSGQVLARPLKEPPPPLPESVPAPVAQVVERLLTPVAGELGFTDAASLIAALVRASAASAPAPAPMPIPAPLPVPVPEAAPPPPPELRDLLVVDDDPNILELAKMLLAPFSYAVDVFLSPEEALAVSEGRTYDVVLADLNFPGAMSGLDLISAVRRRNPEQPVVAMSASQDAAMWEQVLKLGVGGIVAKPLDTTELVAVLERAFSRRRPQLLLVDDSHLARRVFKRFFENRGFAVTVVSGVQAAIDQIEQSVPEVIVSDLHLDDGVGVDVLQHVHDHHPDVRVILMSAAPEADMVIRAHRLNVFDFVNKSEDPRYLLRSVERVVLRHQLDTGRARALSIAG